MINFKAITDGEEVTMKIEKSDNEKGSPVALILIAGAVILCMTVATARYIYKIRQINVSKQPEIVNPLGQKNVPETTVDLPLNVELEISNIDKTGIVVEDDEK